MKNFKVMLVYPNQTMLGVIPNNVALLSACLKKAGFKRKLFGASLYRTVKVTQDELRAKLNQVKKTDIDNYVKYIDKDVVEEFAKEVNKYKPDLIAMSLVDSTTKLGLKLLDKVKDFPAKKIIGGIAVTFNYESLLKHSCADMACVGEGEGALVDLCNALYEKKDFKDIKNLYIKEKDGKIKKNPLRQLVNLDDLPTPDFSIFKDYRFYRPFHGQVVRMAPIDTDRGCPYTCTYCAAPIIRELYDQHKIGKYFRHKSNKKIIKEIKEIVLKHKINFLWFSSETFFAKDEKELVEFANEYVKEINLPFWCQTRLDTFTESKTKMLKDMGCKAVSVGLEHGNEGFRAEILKKYISNNRIIESFQLMKKYEISATVNNMIGFPGENREIVFTSIEMNRKLVPYYLDNTSLNVFIFTPFSGTPLRKICLEKGYLKKIDDTSFMFQEAVLDMPDFPKEEVEGLAKTFTLYVKLPKKYWPRIRIAEENSEEGRKAFLEMSQLLQTIR